MSAIAQQHAFEPYFIGDVVTKWLRHDGDDRLMQLRESFGLAESRTCRLKRRTPSGRWRQHDFAIHNKRSSDLGAGASYLRIDRAAPAVLLRRTLDAIRNFGERMKPRVTLKGERLVVRAHPSDAVARVKALGLAQRLASSDHAEATHTGRTAAIAPALTDSERDLVLLAILQLLQVR